MKKIKLFLAAMAAMVTMGVNAQSWTASEVGAGNFMLYNVGTGQYLTKGNGWGTQASITTAATAGNGFAVALEAVGTNFKIRTNINGDGKGLEHLSGGTIYTDQSNGKNSTWTFTQVGTDNGPIYTIVSADNHGGGSGVYLTAGVDGTIVTPGSDGTIDGAKWKLMSIPAQPIGMADASETNPVDATSLIVNANFSFPAILKDDSWTMVSGNYNPCGGAADNPCAESWRASFTLSQELTVPNGIYELTAQAALTDYAGLYDGANYPVVYANNETAVFNEMSETDRGTSMTQLSGSFTNGDYVVGPIRVVVTSGSLTIGVRGTRTDTWCIWDNFKLTYKGIDLTALKEALQAQIDAVPALEGTTTTAAYNAAKNYADGIDVASLNTEEAISNASSQLAEYVNAAKALQSAYAGYLSFKASVEALDDDAAIYTGDATIDVSAIDATVQATTTLADLNDAIETAKPQMQAKVAEFLAAVTVNEGKRFDITNIYLTNPDFEIPTASGQMPPGWNITIGGANLGQQNRTDTNPDTGLSITNFIEAWHWSSLTAGVIAQTVTSLPEGTYVLECDASVCHDPASGDGSDITGAYLFIKSSLKTEQEPVGNVRLGIKHYSVSFSHGGSGEVQFGLMATDEINANWLSADNFKVYFAGGVDLSIYVDALAEAVAEFEALEAVTDPDVYAEYEAIVNANNKEWSNSSEYQAAIDAVHGATAMVTALNAYAAAMTAASSAIETYPNVTGQELTALNAAVADTPDATVESVEAKTAALSAATSTFIAAAPNYNLYVSELAIAQAISTTVTVDVPTTSAEALAAFKTLKVAEYNYVAGAYPYSATSKIGEFSSWERSGSVNGNTNVEFEALTSQHWSGQEMTYYEQPKGGWNADGATFTANYEKTCTLPAGSYIIKVAARAASGTATQAKITCSAAAMDGPIPNLGDTGKGITTAGVASFDEGEFANGGNGRGWVWNYLPFTLTEEAEVTMTVVAEADGARQWFSVCDGELLSMTNIATAVTYDEAATNTIEDVDVANVTMTRTIKEGYNTVCLPFNLTSNQVQTAFGQGTVVYAFSENSDDPMKATINFDNVVAGTITANVPVLVKATAASNSQTFEGVQIVAAESAVVEGTNFDFVGTYEPTSVAAGDYFIGNGALYKSAGSTNMKAFRAYIQDKNPDQQGEVKLFIDDIETSISEINGIEAEQGIIYNIAGQRVNKAQRGIYIVNGKKVLVK